MGVRFISQATLQAEGGIKMKNLQFFLLLLGMLILFPVLFGLAYLLWNVNHFIALMVLFIGISADLLGGFELLDRALSHV